MKSEGARISSALYLEIEVTNPSIAGGVQEKQNSLFSSPEHSKFVSHWVDRYPLLLALALSAVQTFVIVFWKAGALHGGDWQVYVEDLAIYLIGVLCFYSFIRFALAPAIHKLARELHLADEANTALHEISKTTTLGLSKVTEVRDIHTSRQVRSIGVIAKRIAEELSRDEAYTGYLSAGYIEDLKIAAPLYDLGRIGLSDQILDKVDSFNQEELEMMKAHVIIGGDLISELQRTLPYRTYFSMAKEIIYHHHQRWDGKGYPNVLKDGASVSYFVQNGMGKPLAGEEIPLSARIVSLTDVYNALINDKPWRKAYPHEEACALIAEGKGKQFDPKVVEAFLKCQDDIRLLAEKF